MINKHAQRELFGKPRKLVRDKPPALAKGPKHVPWRQIVIALLLAVIVTSWVLDSLHVRFVPQHWHDGVASYTDAYVYQLQHNKIFIALCQAVGHNPIDDSPITVGSVLVFGVIVGVWLGVSRGSAMFKEEC